MTNEEAIEVIKHGCIYRDRRGGDALRVSISALEKQIPKKTTFEGDDFDGNGNIIYDIWICPCCGKKYVIDYDDYKYCPWCGQALDWSDYK